MKPQKFIFVGVLHFIDSTIERKMQKRSESGPSRMNQQRIPTAMRAPVPPEMTIDLNWQYCLSDVCIPKWEIYTHWAPYFQSQKGNTEIFNSNYIANDGRHPLGKVENETLRDITSYLSDPEQWKKITELDVLEEPLWAPMEEEVALLRELDEYMEGGYECMDGGSEDEGRELLGNESDNLRRIARYEEILSNIQDVSNFQMNDFTSVEYFKSGSCGLLYKVSHPNLGDMAVKQFMNLKFNANDEDKMREVVNLVNMEKCAPHPNIVKFYGCLVTFIENKIWIIGFVMEMADETMHDVIHDSSIKYETSDALSLAGQVIGAIDWLHKQGMIHRDIKPDNMVLFNERTLLKLCDFGSTRSFDHDMTLGIGTLRYMAPELHIYGEMGKYSEKCDIYSMGITLWEMITRKIPFDKLSSSSVIIEVTSGGRPPMWMIESVIHRMIIEWSA